MKFALIEFPHNEDLPDSVKGCVQDDVGRTLFRQALNASLRSGKSEMHSYISGYKALKDAGYDVDENKNWVQKDNPGVGAVHVNRPMGSVKPKDQGKSDEEEKDDPGSQDVTTGSQVIIPTTVFATDSNGSSRVFAEKREKDDPGSQSISLPDNTMMLALPSRSDSSPVFEEDQQPATEEKEDKDKDDPGTQDVLIPPDQFVSSPPVQITKVIRQENGKYHVYSEDGSKHLGGPYSSKEQAVERIRQIEGHKDKVDVAKRISGNAPIHLNSEGQKLAEKLGQRIHIKGGLDVLHCSPLNRAKETADAITKYNPHMELADPSDALRPWRLGAIEGRKTEDVKHLIKHYVEHPDEVPPGKGRDGKPAESFNNATKRQLDFATKLKQDSSAHPNLKIGVVMHSRGMELWQAWNDAGCPDDYSKLDTKDLLHPNDPEHTSMLRWNPNKDKIKEVDVESDDELQPGIFPILHGLTDDDGDEGNAQELEKIDSDGPKPPNFRVSDDLAKSCGTCGYFNLERCMMFKGYPVSAIDVCDDYVAGTPGTMGIKKALIFLPPIEVHKSAYAAYNQGLVVEGITGPLAEQEGLGEAAIREIAKHFSSVEAVTEGLHIREAWGGSHAYKWALRVLKKIDVEKEDDGEWITVNGRHIFLGGKDAKKQELARKNYKPSTKAKQDIADKSEAQVAKGLGMDRTSDNKPFDLIKGKVAVEVKTLISNANSKITMHPESRQRKLDEIEKHGYRAYTVVIDKRSAGTKFYWSAGVGSFRIGSMQTARSMSDLKTKII